MFVIATYQSEPTGAVSYAKDAAGTILVFDSREAAEKAAQGRFQGRWTVEPVDKMQSTLRAEVSVATETLRQIKLA